MPEPLLERERDLEQIEAALRSAREGTGQVVLLEAPAGLGKSRLMAAAAQRAEAAGMLALTAHGSELERLLAFGIALQLVEPAVARADRERRAQLLSGAAALAIPLLEHGPAPAADSSTALTHGLLWLVSNLAHETPAALLVDDAHWADEPSRQLLMSIARRVQDLPLVLVVALRPNETDAGKDLSTRLATLPGSRALELRPLSSDAVGILVRRVLPAAEPAFAERCASATRGNPFLLRAILADMVTAAVEPTARTAERLVAVAPQAVARAASARLSRLGDTATAVARAAAVLGAGTPLRQVAAVAGVEAAEAARAADALAAADVLEPGEPVAYVHPLMRAAVYADIAPSERAAAHRRAADLLEAEGSSVDRVAAHLVLSSPAGDEAVAVTLRRAAARAVERGAPASAAELLTRALAEPPPPDERWLVLRELGTAEAMSGAPAAFDHLGEAAELAPRPEDRAQTLFLLGRRLMMHLRARDAADAFEAGIAAIGETSGPLRTQLEAGFVSAARLDAELRPRALERLERLLADGGSNGGGELESVLLGTVAFERAVAGEDRDGVIRLATRALACSGNGVPDAMAMLAACSALVYAGELEPAEAELRRMLDDATRRGSLVDFARASAFRAHVLYRMGQLAEAAADADAALAQREHGIEVGTPAVKAALAHALIDQGQLESARSAVELEDDGPWAASAPFAYLLEARGRLALELKQPKDAVAQLLACGELLDSLRSPNPSVVGWRGWAAQAAATAGDADRARELAAEELALARDWGAPRALSMALRASALVSDNGVDVLREAVAVLDGTPVALERARALVDLGAALRRGGARREARSALERAIEEARACGARVLEDRARDELTVVGGRPRHAAAGGVAALTPSELRAARMAADGLSNREIAEAVFVTIKAVEKHLASVYRKLGIASRQELPAALARSER